jgi:hypothetical protein
VLVACGLVGLAAGALLVGHRSGLGAALVALGAWAAAAPALWRRRNVSDLVLAGWSAALLSMVAVRDAGWVTGLCLVVGVAAGVVAVTGARSAPAVLLAPLSGALGAIRATGWSVRGVREAAGARGRQLWSTLASLGLTLVLVVGFGALFASADPVFASYLPDLRLDELPGRVVVGLLVGGVAATAAHLARTPPPWSDATTRRRSPAALGAWALPVVALDVVVAAFLLVQVGALVGGREYVERTAGLTVAEYARQGFGQLVAATALTLVVVAVAARRAPRETARERIATSAALSALCLGTLGVVAAALVRMDVYVEEFGLTRLRLLSTWGEVTMGVVVLVVVAAGVRWRGAWVPQALVHVVAVAMLSLALVNPDGQVAAHNGSLDGDGLDVDYLQGLSADAVPAIDAFDEPLRSCVLRAVSVAPVEGPVDWNLGRARAAAVLDGPVDEDAGCPAGGADMRE